ncbi:MAG: phosphoglucosamine mutase [Bacteroidales bacterium]
MTLIKSISGIRGTIGGNPGMGLSPIDIVKFSSAFAIFLKERLNKSNLKLVVGRDARISGPMVNNFVVSSLVSMGVDVIDLGLSTTPTVEMSVVEKKADGGIIITASHNPAQWNALKLLNEKGEFISGQEGIRLLDIANDETLLNYATYDKLGKVEEDHQAIEKHIDAILSLPLVNVNAIRKANFKIALDAVNSTGGMAILPLLKALGVENVVPLYCEPTGDFPHNPEPLKENLTEISSVVAQKKLDLGFVVDPDVDRLAIISENGEMFGEEYTLVAVSDYVLNHTPGNTVSNMSSTRALRDITEAKGMSYFSSAVGEVNVVEKMKECSAIIGGEGNGGVIYPELHYGRDALVGIALFLSHLATSGKKCSDLKESYPQYAISKNKISLNEGIDVDLILKSIEKKYSNYPCSTIDGLKIELDKEWVHLRKSNTEPIIRIYSESSSMISANDLSNKVMGEIKELIK